MKTSPLSHEHIQMLRAQSEKENPGICPTMALGSPCQAEGQGSPHQHRAPQGYWG